MLCSKYWSLIIISLLLFFKSTTVSGFVDPITGTIALGTFVAGYFLHKSNYNLPYFSSSCSNTIDFKELQRDVDKHFFGQHIASKIIMSALKGNSRRSSFNKKPLVMSFHGWTGSGKNFIADLIASRTFSSEKIKKLRYHVFGRTVKDDNIYTKVKSAIKSCHTNIFVFDELQYIPIGMLDVLVPILENHDSSIDSRNSIFIFLTNAGSDAIVEKYLDLWENGYSREQMNVIDFDSILQKSTFNEIGGLKKSKIIDSYIIDHYVPFLPLERKHVIQCIEAELKHLNKTMDSKAISELLQIMPFGPEPQKLFSTSGCKRIKALVTNSDLM